MHKHRDGFFNENTVQKKKQKQSKYKAHFISLNTFIIDCSYKQIIHKT